MEDDISLFLAIEKILQDRMFLYKGMIVVKDIYLAEIYEVCIKDFRIKIRNNIVRFPSDFMIEINNGEYAFTEKGIIMLGGLLKSGRAIKVHIQFIEYFVHIAHENGTSVFDLIKTDKNEF
jgi:hypothetical protein